jgi:hypothetical protein
MVPLKSSIKNDFLKEDFAASLPCWGKNCTQHQPAKINK